MVYEQRRSTRCPSRAEWGFVASTQAPVCRCRRRAGHRPTALQADPWGWAESGFGAGQETVTPMQRPPRDPRKPRALLARSSFKRTRHRWSPHRNRSGISSAASPCLTSFGCAPCSASERSARPPRRRPQPLIITSRRGAGLLAPHGAGNAAQSRIAGQSALAAPSRTSSPSTPGVHIVRR